MKKQTGLFSWALLILLFGAIVYFFAQKAQQLSNQTAQNSVLLDSLSESKGEKFYLSSLVKASFENDLNNFNFFDFKGYELDKGKKQRVRDFNSVFEDVKKKKIIVRYTQIGCNACADSTFKLINRNKKLLTNYEVLVLVDFTDVISYLKWRKIAEVEYPVLLIKKGDLPFPIETGPSSYIFIVNNKKPEHFFIPSSGYTSYLKDYLNSLM